RPPLTRDWDSLEMDRGTACEGRRAGDDSPGAPALRGTSRTAPDSIPTGLSRRVIGEPNGERRGSPFLTPRLRWLRGLDLNQRPLGYDPSAWAHVAQRSPTRTVTYASGYGLGYGPYWGSLGPVHVQNTAKP